MGLREQCRAHRLVGRQLQQPLDVLRRQLGLARRQRQFCQVAQHLGIIEQLAAPVLGFRQRLVEQVARLQRLQRLEEQRALLVQVLGARLRVEQRLGGVTIVAAGQRDAGQLLVVEVRVAGVAHGQFAEQLAGRVRRADLARLRGQRLQIRERPLAHLRRRGGVLQQVVHGRQPLRALGRLRQRRVGALLGDLDPRAQDRAAQVRALHRLHAGEHGLGVIEPAAAGVLLRQHTHETGVVGGHARPRLEVGHGQAIDGAALAEQALAQRFTREHQRQPHPHHGGESQDQRGRQQPLAFSRRSGLRLVAGHGSDHSPRGYRYAACCARAHRPRACRRPSHCTGRHWPAGRKACSSR
ncbi:hypothetical protein D3C81_841100 [compost metagenome]